MAISVHSLQGNEHRAGGGLSAVNNDIIYKDMAVALCIRVVNEAGKIGGVHPVHLRSSLRCT